MYKSKNINRCKMYKRLLRIYKCDKAYISKHRELYDKYINKINAIIDVLSVLVK